MTANLSGVFLELSAQERASIRVGHDQAIYGIYYYQFSSYIVHQMSRPADSGGESLMAKRSFLCAWII